MLRPPTFAENPQFHRTSGTACTWFSEPCRLISIANTGSSYASVCFVHESVGEQAEAWMSDGGDLASIFDVCALPGMEEFTTHFLCAGFHQNGKLVGFWDFPLHWLEGGKHLGSGMLDRDEFKALLNAAKEYAAANPQPACAPTASPSMRGS